MEEIFLELKFIFEGRRKRNGKILHLKVFLIQSLMKKPALREEKTDRNRRTALPHDIH